MFFLARESFSQSQVSVEDKDGYIIVNGNSMPMVMTKNKLEMTLTCLIPKDSVTLPFFTAGFFYGNPEHVILDSTSTIEISFDDSSVFSFNKYDLGIDEFSNDSTALFVCIVNRKFIEALITSVPNELNIKSDKFFYPATMEEACKPLLSDFMKEFIRTINEEYFKFYKDRNKESGESSFENKDSVDN